MKPAIYIASFFDTRSRLYPHRDRLIALGYPVIARWLDEPVTATYAASTEDYLRGCAVRDIKDIEHSSWFVLDTLDETPRGGREVELGVALMLRSLRGRGMRIMAIGPYRNVFHRLTDAHYDTWEAFFVAIQ